MWISSCAAELGIGRFGCCDVMAQRSEREGDCLGVAVAQGEGAEVDDVATGVCFPAAAGALEAQVWE